MRTLKSRSMSTRLQRGFTLIELLLASCLMLTAMALAMSFLSGFNKVSNRTMLQESMYQELRNALNRLDKELNGAAEVLGSKTLNGISFTPSKNTIIFSVPLYSAMGFIVVDSSGKPIQDLVALEIVDDPDAKSVLRMRSSSSKSQLLRITVDPALDSTRVRLTRQVLLRNLMPKHAASQNYDCRSSFLTCPLPTLTPSPGEEGPAGTFTLVKRDGNTTTSEYDKVTEVKILLREEKEYGNETLTGFKQFELRMRNWAPSPTPSPSPSP